MFTILCLARLEVYEHWKIHPKLTELQLAEEDEEANWSIKFQTGPLFSKCHMVVSHNVNTCKINLASEARQQGDVCQLYMCTLYTVCDSLDQGHHRLKRQIDV